MGNKVVTTIRDSLLSTLDGMTCDDLIDYFNEVKEDHGGKTVLDYYFDENNDNRIELRLISIREETLEEEMAAKRKQLESAIEEKKRKKGELQHCVNTHTTSLKSLDADIAEMENRLKEIQSEHSQT